ncbi:MAG: hypothetical protein R6V12_18125, partial [Candidatus Hydrogenedentota bacterium]
MVQILAIGVMLFSSASKEQATAVNFVDHGIAARVSESRGVIAYRDAQGTPLLLAMVMDTMRGGSRTSLLVIDARTGTCEQYWHPRGETTTGTIYAWMVSSKARVYVTFNGVFSEFDLDRRTWTFARDAGRGTAMSFAEAGDGTIYFATYPDSHLLAYVPGSEEIVHCCRLDEKEKYPTSMAIGDDGWVYVGLGTVRANIVAFNPADAKRVQVVDDAERPSGTGKVMKGTDGAAYGVLPGTPWRVLREGEAYAVAEPTPKANLPSIYWSQIRSEFPGGGALQHFDVPDKTFTVEFPGEEPLTRSFAYESAGATITSMAPGPDGKVYGSTSHPFRLFMCETDSGALTNLGGLKKVGGGNFCAMTAYQGMVYAAAYSGGYFYRYDPSKPWRDTGNAYANPLLLVDRTEPIHRPRAIMDLPNRAEVVYSGFPGYGMVGGGMGFYNVETSDFVLVENADLLPGHSIITLARMPDGALVGGTSTDAPGGAEAVASVAKLVFVEPVSRKVVYSTEPLPDAPEIKAVEVSEAGLVYGLTSCSLFFVFDPRAKTV